MSNKKQTVIQHLISVFENCPDENDFWNYFRNNQDRLLKDEKQQIIDAVEWNYKSNMGDVYFKSTFKND